MDQIVSFLYKLWKFLYFKNQLSKSFRLNFTFSKVLGEK